jgi:hypothetical protein
MTRLLIVFVALVSAVQGQPQRPSASIEGVVVKLGTGESLANATVQLNTEVPVQLSGWNIAKQLRESIG